MVDGCKLTQETLLRLTGDWKKSSCSIQIRHSSTKLSGTGRRELPASLPFYIWVNWGLESQMPKPQKCFFLLCFRYFLLLTIPTSFWNIYFRLNYSFSVFLYSRCFFQVWTFCSTFNRITLRGSYGTILSHSQDIFFSALDFLCLL